MKEYDMKYGYDTNGKWFYTYEQPYREPLPFPDECDETAMVIYDTYPDIPIKVLLSGGLDSLVVAESFRRTGIPFSCVTMKMKGGYNNHDIKYAIEYCKQHGIKQDIIELDVLKFWKNQIWDYITPIQLTSPQIAVINWIIDQTDGLPVLGGNFIVIHIVNGAPYVFEYENLTAHDKWLKYRNREGVPRFYRYTTEIRLSQLFDKMTCWFIKHADKLGMKIGADIKNQWYGRHYPQLGKREPITYSALNGVDMITRVDYTGFEYLAKQDMKYSQRAEIYKKYPPEKYNQKIEKSYEQEIIEIGAGKINNRIAEILKSIITEKANEKDFINKVRLDEIR